VKAALFAGLGRTGSDFVGYEMARVIEQEDGPSAVAQALSESPLRFFERYVAISRAHPEGAPHRFGASTEEILHRLSAANPASRGDAV
jgi:hypothetical protein